MYQRLRQFLQDKEIRPFFLKMVLFFLLFFVTFVSALGMTKSFASAHKQKRVKDTELESINNRINSIKNESAAQSEFQKEKALREKLHMVKPGEDLIIILEDEDGE